MTSSPVIMLASQWNQFYLLCPCEEHCKTLQIYAVECGHRGSKPYNFFIPLQQHQLIDLGNFHGISSSALVKKMNIKNV